jgi:hypothetical protein
VLGGGSEWIPGQRTGNGGTRDAPPPTHSGVAANEYQDDERGTGGLETQMSTWFVFFVLVLLIITTLTRLLVQEP